MPLLFTIDSTEEVTLLLNFNQHRHFIVLDEHGEELRPLDFSDSIEDVDSEMLSYCYLFKFTNSLRLQLLFHF